MENDKEKQQKLLNAMVEYLDCPCQVFEPMSNDNPIMAAYREARERGEREGFIPVLVTVDEIVWESLVMNADTDHDWNGESDFSKERVTEYRKQMLQNPLKDDREVMAQWIGERKKEAEEYNMDWDTEVLGEIAGGEAMDRFSGYWDYYTRKTYPVILAEIPVKNCWEIFAWLPFGGWNECPDTPELMAVTKYWYGQYRAVPAVITHDVLEYEVPAPVSTEQAMQLALEQHAWCPDVVGQSEGLSVGMMADCLTKSTVWYFWWE